MSDNTPNSKTSTQNVINRLKDIVKRQTDYDDETAVQKLKEHDNNIINIVREYMKQNATKSNNTDCDVKKNKTTNQKIFTEIRKLMDDASASYRKKKELQNK